MEANIKTLGFTTKAPECHGGIVGRIALGSCHRVLILLSLSLGIAWHDNIAPSFP